MSAARRVRVSAEKGCARCGDRSGHDSVAEARCALAFALRSDLTAIAAGLDRAPAESAVLDLLAHMRTVYEDGTLAHRAAVKVLELGWRPSVGAAS